VEQVDKRPEQVGEIVLEPRPCQQITKRLDSGAELRMRGIRFGQWPRIRLVLAEAVAVERELVE
jgi:hypothetical protein